MVVRILYTSPLVVAASSLLLLTSFLNPAASRILLQEQSCFSTADCPYTHCCLGFYPDVDFQTSGFCVPQGANYDACYVSVSEWDPSTYNQTVFADHCPCLPEHQCRETGEIIPGHGELGICRKPCVKATDCSKEECCQLFDLDPSDWTRRKRDAEMYQGVCTKLAGEGEHCLLVDSVIEDTNFVCPCEDDTFCNITGRHPLFGASGKCLKREGQEYEDWKNHRDSANSYLNEDRTCFARLNTET